MSRIKQKLKSRKGASAVIALLFFLVCLMAGGVILTAATANAGRLTHLRSDQEDYFTVSSAARLLRDDINGAEYAVIETEKDGEAQPKDVTKPSDDIVLKDRLANWAAKAYEGSYNQNVRTTLTMEIGGKTIVNAAAYIHGRDEANAYGMEFYLSLPQEGALTNDTSRDKYMLRLYIPATVTVKEERSKDGKGVVTSVKKTTVVWGEGIITKAGEQTK